MICLFVCCITEFKPTASTNATWFQQVRWTARGEPTGWHQQQAQQSRCWHPATRRIVKNVSYATVTRAQSSGVALSAQRSAIRSDWVDQFLALVTPCAGYLSEHGLATGGAHRGLVFCVQADVYLQARRFFKVRAADKFAESVVASSFIACTMRLSTILAMQSEHKLE